MDHYGPSRKYVTGSPMCWIHALPVELLSDIFTIAASPKPSLLPCLLPKDGDSSQDVHIILSKFTARIQLVCKRWRAVALTTPALWSILDSRKIRADNFALLLERSGILPLHVQITLSYNGDGLEWQRNVDHIFQDHGGRISQLYLGGRGSRSIQDVINVLPENMESLRELGLHDGLSSKWRGPLPSSLELTAPRLRSFSVESYNLNWAKMPVSPDLEYLSVIEDSAILLSPRPFFTALGRYSHLRVLQLEHQDLSRWRGADMKTIQNVVLGKLEKLILRHFFIWEMRMMFRHMVTPELRGFTVMAVDASGYMGEGLGLQCPTLETLALEDLVLSLEIAQELFHVKHLALVENLDTESQYVDARFQSLCSHWQSLPDPLPMETLKTDGIEISCLIPLLEGDLRTKIPNLRKITVHYRDVFYSLDSRTFEKRAEEWGKLSSLVETDVYGLPTEVIEARMRLSTWEEEMEWIKEFTCLSIPEE